MLFSAKESVFKAWYPRHQQWVDFLEVDLHIEPSRRQFVAVLAHSSGPPASGDSFTGTWAHDAEFLLSYVAVAKPAPASFTNRGKYESISPAAYARARSGISSKP